MTKLIKNGDQTIVASQYGDTTAIKNRVPSLEAAFAMDLILNDKSNTPPGAVVERAFDIARLTFQHIKQNRMDTPFPFKKVYGDATDA